MRDVEREKKESLMTPFSPSQHGYLLSLLLIF